MTVFYMRDTGQRSAISILMHNAASHYQLRRPSWNMAIMTLGVGFVLTANPTLMSENHPGLAMMARMADQSVWRMLFLAIGTSRLVALFINGSFPAVRWTPYVRAVMAGISAMLWGIIALSVDHVLVIGTVVYTGICITEIQNMLAAARDAQEAAAGRRRA